MAEDYDDDEDYEGFHYEPLDLSSDQGFLLYKPEEEELFFAVLQSMKAENREEFLEGLYGKYSPTRQTGPSCPRPGPSGMPRSTSVPPRKSPPPPCTPSRTPPTLPGPRIRPLSIDPHSAPPKTRIPRHRQYSTPPPRLARPPLPISPSPRCDLPYSPTLSELLAEGSYSESLDELVQPGGEISWDEPMAESDPVCEAPERSVSPTLSELLAEGSYSESLDELVQPGGGISWDEPMAESDPVCEAPERSVSPTLSELLAEGSYSESLDELVQPGGAISWDEPMAESDPVCEAPERTLSSTLSEMLGEGSYSESLDELVQPGGGISWNEPIAESDPVCKSSPRSVSPTYSECIAEGPLSEYSDDLLTPEPIKWDEPEPECKGSFSESLIKDIKSEPESEPDSYIFDDEEECEYAPEWDETEYLYEPPGYNWDKIIGTELDEEEKERQKYLEEAKINDIISDYYYPGFLDDAINGTVDFNKIIFDLSFGENQPPPDELPDKEPLSLVEAFERRVEMEQGARKKRIKEKAPPPPPPTTTTTSEGAKEVPSGQVGDHLNISGLSLLPETPTDRQIINREEIVLGGVNDLEVAELLRNSPVNELTHAIDCLQKAEIMNEFDKSLQAAEEAYSNAPPDLAECAAIHKASTFKAEDITKKRATIGGGGGSYKPIEIVSYMGITKPVY